jgi:hypothetical protein
VVSIVFVMTWIRSSVSATVNVPEPLAFSNSVNHSASLGSSGVKMSRSVSIRKGIGENVIVAARRRNQCLDPHAQIARRACSSDSAERQFWRAQRGAGPVRIA